MPCFDSDVPRADKLRDSRSGSSEKVTWPVALGGRRKQCEYEPHRVESGLRQYWFPGNWSNDVLGVFFSSMISLCVVLGTIIF